MYKLDSFIKETLRLFPLGYGKAGGRIHLTVIVGQFRRVVQDYTFSNGITVPVGAEVTVPLMAIHLDEKIYQNANEFNGFRFGSMRNQNPEAEPNAKYEAANTSAEFLTFSHGRHPWYTPSRQLQ